MPATLSSTQDLTKRAPSEVRWVVEALALLADLFRPNPLIYWTDFLASLAVGFPALLIFTHCEGFSWWRVVSYLIAVVAVFRAGSFIHEVAHFRHCDMRSFYWGWNVLFGIPLLMPSFFYISHLGHHNRHRFGTRDDAEYLPLAAGRWGTWLEFFIQVPLMPFWVVCRFLISPLTFITPGVRRWVLNHASSFAINFRAKSEPPENAPLREWAITELACSALIWSLLLGVIFDWPLLVSPVQVIAVAIGVLTLNYLRTLVAHRYRSDGEEISFLAKLDDSINIEGHPLLTEIVFPVGLRYHALHHLFPSIPYHNLGTAHRRLMAKLPENSPYRRTVFPSLWSALKSLRADFVAAD